MWNSNNNWCGPGWSSFRNKGSLTPPIPDAVNLRGYMEGDDLDGSGNSTFTNGLPISSAVNLGTLGGTFDQLVALNMPTFSTTAGPGGILPAPVFDGSDFLTSSLPPSAWTFLHDGTGATIYSVVRTATSGTRSIACTSTGVAASRGVNHRYTTSFRGQYTMSDGVAIQATLTTPSGLILVDTFSAFSSTLDAATVNLWVNGALVATVAPATLSSGDPAGSLTIGANAIGGGGHIGPLRRVMAFAGAHDAAMQAAVIAWMQAKDAVTYPAA